MSKESMLHELMKDRYLGDGVYASFDGYQIWLDLRGIQCQAQRTRIAMTNDVVNALVKYRDDVITWQRDLDGQLGKRR